MQVLKRCFTIGIALSFSLTSSAAAQSIWERIGNGLKNLNEAAAETLLLKGTSIDVEQLGLQTIPAGEVTFGIARVDMKDSTAFRIRAFLYNPTAQDVRITPMPKDSINLLDVKGRRIHAIASPRVEQIVKGEHTLTIPAHERRQILILFGARSSDAGVGTLQYGSYGSITGIPLLPSAAPQNPQ